MNYVSPQLAGIVATIERAHHAQRDAKPCPFCGHDMPLARVVVGKYVVGCENEDCAVSPQACDVTLLGAWAKWNARAV